MITVSVTIAVRKEGIASLGKIGSADESLSS
jgi:hypothetical protein